jgi:hypothetical protein
MLLIEKKSDKLKKTDKEKKTLRLISVLILGKH